MLFMADLVAGCTHLRERERVTSSSPGGHYTLYTPLYAPTLYTPLYTPTLYIVKVLNVFQCKIAVCDEEGHSPVKSYEPTQHFIPLCESFFRQVFPKSIFLHCVFPGFLGSLCFLGSWPPCVSWVRRGCYYNEAKFPVPPSFHSLQDKRL